MLYVELTEQIIKGFYYVYNNLGYGFLEKVYENALTHTLAKSGMSVAKQVPLNVHFDGICVGEYFADLIVNGKVFVEIKTVEAFASAHEAQLLNYLRATEAEVGLLMNFGEKPEFRRRILTNDRKALAVTLPGSIRVNPCHP